MTPQQFIAKWQRANLSERSAYQQHFLDLCDLLGQPKPAAADPEGAWYTFERGVHKTTGQKGWGDAMKVRGVIMELPRFVEVCYNHSVWSEASLKGRPDGAPA